MIPVNEPLLDGNEKNYLEECITTGWISSEGPFVERLEKGLASTVGRRHAIAVCNGSAALEAAVAAFRFAPGDQIVMPTFTIISCATAIVRNGCIPLFVDSDPATLNMDISKLVKLVEDEIVRKKNKRLKAIMVVHIYGLPVDMTPVLELASRFGLKIIEDAAEMHGQTYRGRPCGSFGDVSIFSFYPNKHITTGEGGMILTDNDELAARYRSLRNLCFQPHKRFVHEEMGFNFRMTNLQAAVGVAQLERLDEFVAKKKRMGARYTEHFVNLSGVELPLAKTDYADSIYWVYGIILKDEIKCDAEEMSRRLGRRGVGTRPFFWPMHEQPVWKRMGLIAEGSYPVSERLARRGLYIPSGLALKDEQLDSVAAIVIEELKKATRV